MPHQTTIDLETVTFITQQAPFPAGKGGGTGHSSAFKRMFFDKSAGDSSC